MSTRYCKSRHKCQRLHQEVRLLFAGRASPLSDTALFCLVPALGPTAFSSSVKALSMEEFDSSRCGGLGSIGSPTIICTFGFAIAKRMCATCYNSRPLPTLPPFASLGCLLPFAVFGCLLPFAASSRRPPSSCQETSFKRGLLLYPSPMTATWLNSETSFKRGLHF